MADIENSSLIVLTKNRDFIVKNLDAEDMIDELIQERLIMGRSAARRLKLAGKSKVDKNQIIFEQLTIAGPDAVYKFCKVLRNNKRQGFIAEELEKSECEAMHTRNCTEYAKKLNQLLQS